MAFQLIWLQVLRCLGGVPPNMMNICRRKLNFSLHNMNDVDCWMLMLRQQSFEFFWELKCEEGRKTRNIWGWNSKYEVFVRKVRRVSPSVVWAGHHCDLHIDCLPSLELGRYRAESEGDLQRGEWDVRTCLLFSSTTSVRSLSLFENKIMEVNNQNWDVR